MKKDECVEEWEAVEAEVAKNGWKRGRFGGRKRERFGGIPLQGKGMDGGLKVRLEGSSRMKVGARKEGETPRHEGERAILCSFLSEGGHW